ncbi:ABC transporter permease [Methylovirgula ligni]|uniref:Peptide/nickel transport system permease protein n=1 Tax=Methylovirgula ligni TaxID=569860 RepID=A0A3D9YNA1_9HYPH|nr:ABC transporter permease [Methylovirgula ligni]QAY96624.1 ABC transporter permease [Methylovirgula ligni]REF84060.1 peptide/nickel transport system permease protein [Methylovirgula ligni]
MTVAEFHRDLSPPLRFLVRVLTRAIPTLAGVIIVSFVLLKSLHGDAVDVMASQMGTTDTTEIAKWRHDLGLDQSTGRQLLNYIVNLARFNFGYSYIYNTPVANLIAQRLPATVLLAVTSFVIALSTGILAGVASAYSRGGITDKLISLALLFLYSVPAFCVGLTLIEIFVVRLGWLPLGDAQTLGIDLSGAALIGDRLRHLVLPAATLSLFYTAIYGRLVRASMLEVRHQDYIKTAVAKGLHSRTVVWKHMLRNALLPITAVAGNHIGAMLGGAVTVETVFNWPGLGRLAFEAVMKRDFTVLLAILVLSAMFAVIANIVVDLVHAWIDPRIEY